MKLPEGFQLAGGSCGIKGSGKPDLGLIYSATPLNWALAATQNRLKAPCVTRNQARYGSSQSVHGIVVNSGNANCANGERGIWDNEDFAAIAVNALGLSSVQVILTASTGVIGQKLEVDKLRQALPLVARDLSNDSSNFAEAILTTDTRTKQIAANLSSGARIVGIAKGSGMIHPNMATMLAFIMTDAVIPQENLRTIWPGMVERSFNQVTVDGDSSPNDMAMVFSSQQVPTNEAEFIEALEVICQNLAQKIARDGEGASKLITVNITGAKNRQEARAAARAVVRSPLVKAAAHGNDPNWGRILVAVGATIASVDLANLEIRIQNVTVYKGIPQDFDAQELSAKMAGSELLIEIDLAAGPAVGTAWGCDLSEDYVHINADYHT